MLVDPFLTGNPKAAATADEVAADVILLTHGHGDHLGDTVDIAKRTGATVRGDRRARGRDQRRRRRGRASIPNYGGTVSSTGAGSSSCPAWHTAVSPKRHARTRPPAC